MIELNESQIIEAYQHEPVRVVWIDIARMDGASAMTFKRDGNWLVIEAAKFPEWIAEDMEYMGDGDGYVFRMGTMPRIEFETLPEHSGW